MAHPIYIIYEVDMTLVISDLIPLATRDTYLERGISHQVVVYYYPDHPQHGARQTYLLMEEILQQLVDGLSHSNPIIDGLQCFRSNCQ